MSVLMAQLQGRSAIGTCIAEAAGSFASLTAAHAATDSFKHISYSSTPSRDDQLRRDVRTARDDISVMTRNRSHEFTISSYFLPRGLAVPPDIGPFWTAGIGSQTIGGSSVTYGYARVPPSVAWIISGGEPTLVAQEKGVGGLVNETTIALTPGEEPTVQFSGIASNIVRILGVGNITAGASSATQTLGAGEAYHFQVGSIVQVVAANGSVTASNLRMTARNLGANQITLSASVDTTTGGPHVVRPYTPWSDASANQGGEPIAAWNGSLSVNGVTSYALAGANITVANGWTEKRVQFNPNFIDAGVSHRTISGTLTFFAREFDLGLLARAEETPDGYPSTINPISIELLLGDATNGQCLITLPNVVLSRTPLSIPEDGDATFELGFMALSTFTSGVPNNDAITVTFS